MSRLELHFYRKSEIRFFYRELVIEYPVKEILTPRKHEIFAYKYTQLESDLIEDRFPPTLFQSFCVSLDGHDIITVFI